MPTVALMDKARRYYQTGRVDKTGDEFVVHGDTGDWTATIVGPSTCTCPASQLAHRTCSHIEAVWLEVRWGGLHRAITRGLNRTTEYDRRHQEADNG